MKEPTAAVAPARPASQWPIGIRLRFHPRASLQAQHRALRGKPVLVLSKLKLMGPSHGQYSWRQQVLVLSTGKLGWARPEQLDLPIDDLDDGIF
ncbi:hypothetical protein [Solimonas terrae]|uniref:Uncharacterized protein n=1 Tax=Solimonas terrae TaxID=1396819 RepID=A0A6M2BNV6_9GAMM|nr:hypothetical protein [Solimonas terrae]NGY03891.1 hypothetical protein [Solimonas terrae]